MGRRGCSLLAYVVPIAIYYLFLFAEAAFERCVLILASDLAACQCVNGAYM